MSDSKRLGLDLDAMEARAKGPPWTLANEDLIRASVLVLCARVRELEASERSATQAFASDLTRAHEREHALRVEVGEAMLLVESAEFRVGAERDIFRAERDLYYEQKTEAETHLAKAQASAAVMREALESAIATTRWSDGVCVGCGEKCCKEVLCETQDQRDDIHRALASDAGRALAERVRLLEAVVTRSQFLIDEVDEHQRENPWPANNHFTWPREADLEQLHLREALAALDANDKAGGR